MSVLRIYIALQIHYERANYGLAKFLKLFFEFNFKEDVLRLKL